MERRDFLRWSGGLAALGLLVGCGRSREAVSRLREPWPDEPGFHDRLRLEGPPAPPDVAGATRNAPLVIDGPVRAISRDAWGAKPPLGSRLRKMGGVRRVTIHHEGNPKPSYETATDDVASALRTIQSVHRRKLRAADIGYHYIIDRAGRVWEGRSVAYQGAHVRSHNPHNIGVMVMGNFEIQRPSPAQLAALDRLVATLLSGYHLSAGSLHCHRDLARTACPGRHLANHVASLRTRIV